MLYQVARWFAVLGVTVALISEALTYLALLLSAICWLIGDWKQHQVTLQGLWGQFVQALRQRKWWAWFLLAATVWIVQGLLAAAIQGNPPRSSHLYKAFFVLTAVVGYRVLPSFSGFFWRRLVAGALLGAGVASGAGYLQYNKGSFPAERMLMSEAEKTDKRHYRGQLYKPGTRIKAATGPLRNRIKTSVTLVWVLGLLVGLSQITKSWRSRMGLVALAVLFGTFSFYTFAKAGFGVSVLCLFGVIVLQYIPSFRKLILGVLTAAFVIGMGIVIVTGANYATDVAAPIATDKVSIRGFAWSHGLKVVQGYPLLGAGLGTYSKSSRAFFLDPDLAFSYTINGHCQHLTAWAEGGPIGALAWLSIIGLIAWAIHKSWSMNTLTRGVEFSCQRVTVTFVLVAVFLMSFVHDFLFHPSVAALFWMVVGLSGYLALGFEDEPRNSNA